MYFVYLLRTGKNSIYTGSTPNLKHRLRQHRNGKCMSTRKLGPLQLIWFCAFPTRLSARRFENYLKTGSGQAFRNKRLLGV
ncbi:GIY-YIG nuclease family protein [Patescibacteria group bacterium]